jgi:hypothetical protein
LTTPTTPQFASNVVSALDGLRVTLYAGLKVISIILDHRFLVIIENAEPIAQFLKFLRCKLDVFIYPAFCILAIYLHPFPSFSLSSWRRFAICSCGGSPARVA